MRKRVNNRKFRFGILLNSVCLFQYGQNMNKYTILLSLLFRRVETEKEINKHAIDFNPVIAAQFHFTRGKIRNLSFHCQ